MTPARVFVVDDMPDVRRVFAEFLAGAGLHVTEADGGRAALQAARRTKPDLVVTDIRMPDMDGIELCRLMRADPATSDVPIVVVSGDAGSQAEAAWAAGCDAVLGKPCSRTLLVATVQQLLASRRRR